MTGVMILGPVEVRGRTGVVPLGGSKTKAVLALLAVEANRPVTTESLIETLWGGQATRSARNAIHVYIAALRKALGEAAVTAVIETHDRGYALHVSVDAVDRDRFVATVSRAQTAIGRGDREGAASDYRTALAMFRGESLFGLRDYPELRVAGAILDELELTAFEEFCTNEIVLGRGNQLHLVLEQRARRHPLREDLWHLFALELYRSGRQTRALDALRTIRTALADQLGIDPGVRLRELEVQILRQDPRLLARSTASAPTPG